MKIAFETLAENSKIWVYQANRNLKNEETEIISQKLATFFANWDSHGTALDGASKILFNRFIIIGVNSEVHAPSGCSIDKSVAIIKEIEAALRIVLLDKSEIAFWQNKAIQTVKLQAVKSAVSEEKIKAETLIFNNTITTKKELDTNWQIQANASWLKRHFKIVVSV